MYHQVQVPKDQQSFLRFLWWGNHDIDTERHDYVICAHVFGAISSASYSNYALCRTAMENEAVFEEAAASDALHHNFYVEDQELSGGYLEIYQMRKHWEFIEI